ncbi:MAG: helix-turn-helix domain-containing protein [Bacteroidaceae bacterium]|nr:helix-turn-helix domain-containing protein [Bacteroidaceae bacterium]
MNDSIMTLNDAAPFIGKSVSAVRKMCQRNQIPAHRVNYRWMFLKSEILIWLKEQ